jgi:hypothetical protein
MRTILITLLAGCFSPTYNNPSCGPTGECPSGLVCSAGTCVTSINGDGNNAGSDAKKLDAFTGRDFSTDRSKFFGASRCAQAGTQLCEDFESGTLDTSVWSTVGVAPTIDTQQAARGSHALHISMTGNGPSYIKETKTFPEVPNTYYARAFVYFVALPTAPGMSYSHWTAFAASTDLGEIRVSGQFQNGKNLFGVGTDSASGTGDWTTSDNDPAGAPMAVPTGQWICIEWLHDGAADETRFWWDATEHVSMHTTASMHGGNTNPYTLDTFTAVWFGWQEYQTSTEPFELWLDEIAVDTQRIGCVL